MAGAGGAGWGEGGGESRGGPEGLGENGLLRGATFRSDGERPCGWGAREDSGTVGSLALVLLCAGLGGPRGVLERTAECLSTLWSPRPWALLQGLEAGAVWAPVCPFAFQRRGGALTACRHWLPKTSARARCTVWPRRGGRASRGPWAARPAAPCCGACPRGGPHRCSRPLCATPTRPCSPWTPRPQRCVLRGVTQPRLGSAASAYCLRWAPERVSAARRTVGSTSAAARAMTLETSV